MPANKLILIYDDGRGDHLYIKPDDLSTATKVLTEEEEGHHPPYPRSARSSSFVLRAARPSMVYYLANLWCT